MKPHTDSKCGVCATAQFERNNYFYGKQFTVRDLQQEQSYFNDKRYLINRMVLGWGVVCGLDVYWDSSKRRIVVKPGMALDCCGHEIVVCEDQYLSLNDNDDDCCFEQDQKRVGKFVLCLEYNDCLSEPVDLPPAGCDEKGKTEYNRIRDTFRLRLKNWDDACPKEPPDGVSCSSDYKHDTDGQSDRADCQTPSLHHYLCDKLKHCCECDGCDCVIIATITIEAGEPQKGNESKDKGNYAGQSQKGYDAKKQNNYGEQTTGYKDPDVDSCTNRKLVYNNSLLYDLIYCNHGDLPHIVDFSWRKGVYPSRKVAFGDFVKLIKDGLKVYFDKEMTPESLNPHTFLVCYLYRESGTFTYIRKQISVDRIDTGWDGDCFTATLVVRPEWIDKELDADDSELLADLRYEPGVTVEITLRGSRIWSTAGKGLDGDYLADKLPTGNGTQGGDFIDWFSVVPPETTEKTKPKGKSYEGQF